MLTTLYLAAQTFLHNDPTIQDYILGCGGTMMTNNLGAIEILASG